MTQQCNTSSLDQGVVWTNRQESDINRRPVLKSMARGARLHCPHCNEGSLFGSYLKVSDECPVCGEEFYHHRADDAPPYFTIIILGHLIVPLLMAVELAYAPPIWLHLAIWLPLTTLLALLLLPRIKGAIVALQWALRMHGFESEDHATALGITSQVAKQV